MNHTEIIKKLKEIGKNEVAEMHLDQLEGIDEETPEKYKKKFIENARKFVEAFQPPTEKKEGYRDGVYTKLLEAQIGVDGTIPIKIIEAGWGSSGYYPESVLKRDVGIYKEGTKMYWNHPTITEEMERPERSLNDLAGVLVSNGKYLEDGPRGAGIYAKAKVFGQYHEKLNEMAEHIGLSHIARGKATFGEAEGKSGNIIENLLQAESVDFVTQEGAGGKVVELFESARTYKNKPENKTDNMDKIEVIEKELSELKESKLSLETENRRLKESIAMRDAKVFVVDAIKDAELPNITKVRLAESLAKNPILDEKGNIDKVKYAESIKKATDDEIKYLADLSESGSIKWMNSSEAEGEEFNSEGAEKELKESFIRMGYEEKTAEIMAKGKN